MFWFGLFELYNEKRMFREAIETLKEGYIKTYYHWYLFLYLAKGIISIKLDGGSENFTRIL